MLKDTGELRDSIPRQRAVLKEGGRYFERENTNLRFISSGCRLVDLALGGGWVLGRISNVVGDKSTGKTLLAEEVMSNFALQYPDPDIHLIRYVETEDAFDPEYAEALGVPMDRVELEGDAAQTVGDFEKDLEAFVKRVPAGGAGLYILDSLDALMADDEVKRKTDKKTGEEKGTYGTARAKKMSQLFRRLRRKIKHANVHLMIVSQLRDKIGVMFGEKQTRVGGRALDFYATHIIWLAEIGKIAVTRSGVKRPIGINVKLRVKKNKVSPPFRDVQYPVLFAYGIDDMAAALDWLLEVGRIGDVGLDEKSSDAFLKDFYKLEPHEARKQRRRINQVLGPVWYEIEKKFMPPKRKY